MNSAISTLIIRFSTTSSASYRVDLESPDVGERHGLFAPPYTAATWQAIMLALEPGFVLAEADKTVQAALKPLGDLTSLPRIAGAALANALLADDGVRLGFDVALGRAEALRRPLPVEMHFGARCDALAALPWELLHYRDRFLLADTSIALSRYPEGATPPTPALGELPLRVLLVLSEPVGASPIFPERAREELLHGLRTLDEAGAVVVDLLRPPTFSTLVEAVTNGGYHMLVFYGHGGYDPDSGGLLLFEDEFGGQALIKASELGAALRNTDVRLVLLGACQSATTADLSSTGNLTGLTIWSGTAPALVRAGVPLAIGMQVSMRVDAAQAFIRQFALSLAAGKPVIEAVGDARKLIIRGAYGEMWYAPALYGRPAGEYRLFDSPSPLPSNTTDLLTEMRAAREEIEQLENAIRSMKSLDQPGEIVHLRKARARFAQARTEVARRTRCGYAAVVSPVYRVPTNRIFVGRAQELHDVAQAFVGGHPVVIWGTGGIGKTWLAAEVAHRQSWRFPGGVLWLDCSLRPAFDSLLNQIGAFAGIEAIDKVEPDKKEMTVRWALAGLNARCLLVWDNAEEVWDERSVRRFVEGLPANCQALLTTRENPEQAMWPTVELGPLSDQAMHDLFCRLAAAAGIKAGSQADLDAIPLILDRLQGHPFGLKLVVGQATTRSLHRVLADLEAQPLKGIEAAIEISYRRLDRLQRRIFTHLSVFSIPFEWPAVEFMIPQEKRVDDALDILVRRKLLDFNGSWYSYHPLLRQIAYHKLKRARDPRPVHRKAAEYLSSKGGIGLAPIEAFELSDQWERADEHTSFVLSVMNLADRLMSHGYWEELEIRLEKAVEVAFADPNLGSRPSFIARMFQVTAAVANRRSQWEKARGLWEKASAYFRQAGDIAGVADCYTCIGSTYADQGDWITASSFQRAALQQAEEQSDLALIGRIHHNMGVTLAKWGDYGGAIESYGKDLEICQQLRDSKGIAETLTNLGSVYIDAGEFERAIDYLKRAQAIVEAEQDLFDTANVYNELGNAYFRKDELEKAISFHQKALALRQQLGDVHGVGISHMNLGNLWYNLGYLPEAMQSHHRAIEIFTTFGDTYRAAATSINLGVVHQDRGEWHQAIECFNSALHSMEQLGNIRNAARARNATACVYVMMGQEEQAVGLHRQAVQDLEQLPDVRLAAGLIEKFASAHALKRAWRESEELLLEALALYERLIDQRSIASLYTELSEVASGQRKLDQATQFARKSLAISKVTANPVVEMDAYQQLGKIANLDHDPASAIRYLERCLEMSTRLGYRHKRARALIGLGEAYFQQEDWSRALGSLEEALSEMQRLGDLDGTGKASIMLATTHLKAGHTDVALPHYRHALELFEGLGDADSMGVAYLGIGYCYSANANWTQARQSYTKAARHLAACEETGLLAEAYHQLAKTHEAEGDWDGALDYTARAMEIKEALSTDRESAGIFRDLGRFFAQKGDIQRALRLYQRALAICQRIHDSEAQAEICCDMAEACLETNRRDDAAHYAAMAFQALDVEDSKILSRAFVLMAAALGSKTKAMAYLAGNLSEKPR